MYWYPHQAHSDWGSHIKGHDVQDWATEHDTEWRFHLTYDPQTAGLIEKKKGILK